MSAAVGEQVDGEVVVAAGNYLGESPVWSVGEQALYWINCEEPAQLWRWDAANRTTNNWPMPERIGGMALRRDGGVTVALGWGIYDFDRASGALTPRAASPFPEYVKLHESACDRGGRLWIGAMITAWGPTTCARRAARCAGSTATG